MFTKLSNALRAPTAPAKPAADHNAASRATTYTELSSELASAGVPVPGCDTCDDPCDSSNAEAYPQYVLDRYGDLGVLPAGFDTDWDTHLAGSATGGRGRILVISTGKSDWERDHFDESGTLPHHLHKHIQSHNLPSPESTPKDFSKAPPVDDYILDPAPHPPSLYSSSLMTQSDDPEDQTVLVFPDWTVVQEVENSREGAATLYSSLGGGGGRQRSWVMPYRAIILLCSHKRRDKRCHIAAPLLRSALHVCLAKHNIGIDETGSSLAHLDGPLEDISADERQVEINKRKHDIEGLDGEGGEVGIFNINHLGGHRYAGVMLILFPSGAYLSYGRVTPQEIPRVVEGTILQGKVVPGLLRNAVGVTRKQGGFLAW